MAQPNHSDAGFRVWPQLLTELPRMLRRARRNPRRIRVCEFTPSLSGGGAEERIARVLASLDRQEFELSWLGFGNVQHKLTERAGDGVVVVPLARNPSRGVEGRLILRVAMAMAAIRPDVVHVHNWSTSLYGIVAARMTGVPVVIYGDGGRDTPLGPSRRRRALMRGLAPQVDCFTAVCDFLGRELCEHWGVAPGRVAVIRNGVELDKLDRAPGREEARARLGVPQDALLVGTMAGRFRAVKRLPNLIDAVGRIAAARPNLHLALVGDPLGLADELRWRAEVRQLGPRFHMPGHVTPAHSVLRAFDVLVNCSAFEGASNAVIEAMGAGIPVVATAVGGTPELIKDGETGLLVPSEDVHALSQAIARFTDSAELRSACGAAARAHVSREHTHEGMLHRYAELYRSMGAAGMQRSPWRALSDLRVRLFSSAGSVAP